MSDFTAGCTTRRPADPRKRVNYTTGLVLGEDEFVQDQTHLRERDHLAVRALHGYGTVAGLEVGWDVDTGQLSVAPGLAVDGAGRLVCVPSEQCAELSPWLTRHRDELVAEGEDGDELPDEMSLYVVLCYRECETDHVPLPSESCRSADDSMAASRIAESFDLRLVLAPPAPSGEVVGDALGVAIEQLLTVAAGEEEGEADAIREELRAWATNGRPELPDLACLPAPEDGCVLLARVDLGLDDLGEGNVAPVDPEVDDAERPVLLSTRFLQEWLTGLISHPELFVPRDHSLLDNLDADDHPQYLLVDGSRPMTGSLDAGANTITNLRRSNGATHAMRRDEIVGLDLGRTSDGLRVVALQGEPVEASGDEAPSAGDVLRYDGTRWVPASVAAPDPGDPVPVSTIQGVLPLVTVQLIGRSEEGGAGFLVWFHLEGPDATEVLMPPSGSREPLVLGENLEIRTETCDDGRLRLTRVRSDRVTVRQVACNVFRIDLNRQEAELLRFEFLIERLVLSSGMSVAELGQRHELRWVGQTGPDVVTAFVVNPSVTRPLPGFDRIDLIVRPGGGGRLPIDPR